MSGRKIAVSSISCAVVLFAGYPVLALAPADLCTGNPCVVSQDVEVDADFNHDFGPATELRFASGVKLTIRNGSTFDVEAGEIVVEPGARFTNVEPGCILGFSVDPGNFTFGTPTEPARIDFKGCTFVSTFADGDIFWNGKVKLKIEGDDAYFETQSFGDTTIMGSIKANGDKVGGYGPELGFCAQDGTLDLSAKIVAKGTIDFISNIGIDAGTAAVSSKIQISGNKGFGGELRADVANDFTFTGKLNARGKRDPDEPNRCDGGYVSVTAGGSVAIDGPMNLKGGGTGCAGGSVDISVGANLSQGDKGKIRASSSGFNSDGGAFDLRADGNIVLGSIDARGAQGGQINALADGTVTVTDKLKTDAKGPSIGDGEILLTGECGLTVDSLGKITSSKDSDAADGYVELTTSGGPMFVDGKVSASSEVALQYVVGFDPAISGNISPAPTLVELPGPGTCVP